jgi:hypothetical protein
VPDLMVLEGSGHQGKLSSVSQHNQGEKSTCQHKLNGLVIHVSCRINRLHGSAGLSVGGQYHSQADGESVCVPARKSKLSTRTACIKVNLAYCSSTAVLWCMLSRCNLLEVHFALCSFSIGTRLSQMYTYLCTQYL